MGEIDQNEKNEDIITQNNSIIKLESFNQRYLNMDDFKN
jgi:hypothetical protein